MENMARFLGIPSNERDLNPGSPENSPWIMDDLFEKLNHVDSKTRSPDELRLRTENALSFGGLVCRDTFSSLKADLK